MKRSDPCGPTFFLRIIKSKYYEFTSTRQCAILRSRGDHMTNREIMLSALKEYTFPQLKERGFFGNYPNFRRNLENCIEFISFQTNTLGGSFAVEVSAVFPDSKNTNYSLYFDKDEEEFSMEATKSRHRLPGMFDGWFYYRDVYSKRMLFFGQLYYDVPEQDAERYTAPKGSALVQKFNEETAVAICNEINAQLQEAYQWLADFEQIELEKAKA